MKVMLNNTEQIEAIAQKWDTHNNITCFSFTFADNVIKINIEPQTITPKRNGIVKPYSQYTLDSFICNEETLGWLDSFIDEHEIKLQERSVERLQQKLDDKGYYICTLENLNTLQEILAQTANINFHNDSQLSISLDDKCPQFWTIIKEGQFTKYPKAFKRQAASLIARTLNNLVTHITIDEIPFDVVLQRKMKNKKLVAIKLFNRYCDDKE